MQTPYNTPTPVFIDRKYKPLSSDYEPTINTDLRTYPPNLLYQHLDLLVKQYNYIVQGHPELERYRTPLLNRINETRAHISSLWPNNPPPPLSRDAVGVIHIFSPDTHRWSSTDGQRKKHRTLINETKVVPSSHAALMQRSLHYQGPQIMLPSKPQPMRRTVGYAERLINQPLSPGSANFFGAPPEPLLFGSTQVIDWPDQPLPLGSSSPIFAGLSPMGSPSHADLSRFNWGDL